MRSNQNLKQRFLSALMAVLEMVVTRPGDPSSAFAHRNDAVVTELSFCHFILTYTFFIHVMIDNWTIIGVLMDTPLGSDELKELRTIQLLIQMPVTIIQLKVAVGKF